MTVQRVFIDSNILISGLAFNGNEETILRLAGDNLVCLVISEAVLKEVRNVIQRKFPELIADVDELLTKVLWETVEFPSHEEVAYAQTIVRDPNDAAVLASILLSKPDIALSGDKDLLTEEVKKIAPVCRCVDYLRSLTTDNR